MSIHQGRFTIGISAWEEEEENQGRSILEISRFYVPTGIHFTNTLSK